ncbi:cysteine desulfurase family protein [Clostridium sp. DL1XJH146]
MDKNLYLDNAASTYVKKEVLDVMIPYFIEYYGNASSVYSLSRKAKDGLEESRKKISKFINCKSSELYFTSGGTEGDNWAIKGIAFANKDKGKHIITSAIEHAAVLKTCEYLKEFGFDITYLPVDNNGFVNINELKDNIREDTILVSIMTANNEIGTIQDIKAIGNLCRKKEIIFHTDAVQALGKIPIDVEKLNIDLMTISAHKIYGPKGIGALYIKKGVKIHNLLHGGAQERDRRSGTENVPAIVGFGKAVEILENNVENNKLISEKRDYIINELLNIENTRLNGPTLDKRISNNINVTFDKISSELLLIALDNKGIAASAGSACSAGAVEDSHVLKAIGLDKEEINSSIRFSIGEDITDEEIRFFINKIKEIIERMRNFL